MFYCFSDSCIAESHHRVTVGLESPVRPLVIFLVIGSHGIVNIIFREGIIHRLSLTVKSRNQRGASARTSSGVHHLTA